MNLENDIFLQKKLNTIRKISFRNQWKNKTDEGVQLPGRILSFDIGESSEYKILFNVINHTDKHFGLDNFDDDDILLFESYIKYLVNSFDESEFERFMDVIDVYYVKNSDIEKYDGMKIESEYLFQCCVVRYSGLALYWDIKQPLDFTIKSRRDLEAIHQTMTRYINGDKLLEQPIINNNITESNIEQLNSGEVNITYENSTKH